MIHLIQDIGRVLLPFIVGGIIWFIFYLFEQQKKKFEIQGRFIDAIFSQLYLSKAIKTDWGKEKDSAEIKKEILDKMPEVDRKIAKEILGI